MATKNNDDDEGGIKDQAILEDLESFDSGDRAIQARNRKVKEQLEMAATDIVREENRTQIILPSGMSLTKAMRTLYEKKKQEETKVAIHEVIYGWPMDAAVAFQRVLERKFGFVSQVPTPGFFGPTPPHRVGVRINHKGETIQVNWGRMEISVMDHGWLSTGVTESNGDMVFFIGGEVKKKFEAEVRDIAQKTREEVRAHSIYKAQAIRLDFRDIDGDRKPFAIEDAPDFIYIDPEQLDDVVYNSAVQGVVEMALMNPIKYPEACRKIGVPLKRGALLEGPFGTGKTLTAYQMAAHGTKNGFTFIYLMDVRDLDLAMRFAEHYAPAIVFAEDIDQVARVGMRDKAEINKITNILDGVDAKKKEIFVVFTTNFKSAIDGVFIRPGRIDAVVTLHPPDRDAAVRLIRKYGVDQTKKSIINAAVTDQAIGDAVNCLVEARANAAFLRETVERAKLSAIPGYVATGNLELSAADIEAAALSMIPHLELQQAQSPIDGVNTMGEDAMAAAMASMMAPPPNVLRQMMKAMQKRKTGF
jgi:transitional endoplasmic reticulum ATPase